METDKINELMTRTFSGMGFYGRDLTLDSHLPSKYQPGLILHERGFVDLTYKLGGLTQPCRFLVASAMVKDLGVFNPDAAKTGHVVLSPGHYFKVLDVINVGNHTQILLLNFPAEAKQLFSDYTIEAEEQVKSRAKALFEKLLAAAPIEELQSQEWLERTSSPIGMDENGNLF
ncbi:MAG: hypothetical protein KDC49_06910 [Saprospiraceae bacterium]|nr:hypothetical protein [Saprospiraceae bacterium]